jgi:hypothetical protein
LRIGRLADSAKAAFKRRISSAVEQRFCKPKVGGSIPSSGTKSPSAIVRNRPTPNSKNCDFGTSPKVHNLEVYTRVASEAMMRRKRPFAKRADPQRRRFDLRRFPTTTIGSFAQTSEVRMARSAHARGAMDDAAYEGFLRAETQRALRWQEDIGLDVLVHGEFVLLRPPADATAEQLQRLVSAGALIASNAKSAE